MALAAATPPPPAPGNAPPADPPPSGGPDFLASLRGVNSLSGLLKGSSLAEKMVLAWLREKDSAAPALPTISALNAATNAIHRLTSIRKTMLQVAASPKKFTPPEPGKVDKVDLKAYTQKVFAFFRDEQADTPQDNPTQPATPGAPNEPAPAPSADQPGFMAVMQDGLATLHGLLEGTELAEKMTLAWLEEKDAAPTLPPIGELCTASHTIARLGSIRKTMLQIAANPDKYTPPKSEAEKAREDSEYSQWVLTALREFRAKETAKATAPGSTPQPGAPAQPSPSWTDVVDAMVHADDEEFEENMEMEDPGPEPENFTDRQTRWSLPPKATFSPFSPGAPARPKGPRHPFAHVLPPASSASASELDSFSALRAPRSDLDIPSVPTIQAIPVCPTLWSTARELMAAQTPTTANPCTPAPEKPSSPTDTAPSTPDLTDPSNPTDPPYPPDPSDPSSPIGPSSPVLCPSSLPPPP